MNQDNKHLIDVAKILFYMIIYVIKMIQEKSVPGASAEGAADDLERFIKNNIHD